MTLNVRQSIVIFCISDKITLIKKLKEGFKSLSRG